MGTNTRQSVQCNLIQQETSQLRSSAALSSGSETSCKLTMQSGIKEHGELLLLVNHLEMLCIKCLVSQVDYSRNNKRECQWGCLRMYLDGMLALIFTHNTHIIHHVFIRAVLHVKMNLEAVGLAIKNRFQIATGIKFYFC